MTTEAAAEVKPGDDDAVVQAFGYRPALRRTLSSWSAFGISFSTISITSGIFVNFQFGFDELGPASVWTWPVVAVGQILIALVLADLARRIPLAGASYQWARHLVGSGYGWLVGALGVMYIVVGIPGIALLAASPLLQFVLGMDGTNPRVTLAVALAFITVAFLANVIGVALAARINNVAVWCELAGTAVVAIILFALWATDDKPSGHGIGFLTDASHPAHQSYWYAVVLASLAGLYTLVGAESAADLAEDTKHPERTVPRAIVRAVATSAVVGFAVLVGFTLAVPGNGELLAAGGLPAVFVYWLGLDATRVVIAVVVFAMFGLTVAGGAACGRLLFALGRDDLLPGSRELARPRGPQRTPVAAVVVSWVLCVAVMLYGYASGDAFGTLVSATALVPFVIYLLLIGAYLWRRNDLPPPGPHATAPGRWLRPVSWLAFAWVIAAVLAVSLPDQARDADYYLAGGLVLAGGWWAVAKVWRVRSEAPAG